MARYSGNVFTRLITTTDDAVELKDTVWDDLRFPATAIKAGLTNPPTFSDSYVGWLFDDNSTEIVFFIGQLPHKVKLGSSIVPHIHWSGSVAPIGTQSVYWRFEYAWISSQGEAYPGTFTTINKIAEVPATPYEITITSFGSISKPVGESNISDLLFMKLSRIGRNASDDFPDLAFLVEADLHYEISTLGSRQEYVK